MKFITQDDPWGIRQSVRKIYLKNYRSVLSNAVVKDKYMLFDIFFNQFVPPVWRASKESVYRHVKEIENLIQAPKRYSPLWVWILKHNQRPKCAVLTENTLEAIEKGQSKLLTYPEIEKTKNEWQKKVFFRKEEGFSFELKEEYVQLRIRKRGGEQNG